MEAESAESKEYKGFYKEFLVEMEEHS